MEKILITNDLGLGVIRYLTTIIGVGLKRTNFGLCAHSVQGWHLKKPGSRCQRRFSALFCKKSAERAKIM